MRRLILATLGLILLAVPAEAAFTHVRVESRPGASSTSQAITTTTNVTSGNLLVMAIGITGSQLGVNGVEVTGVSGSTGCNGTWTKAFEESVSGLAYYQVWYSTAASTDACTVTATLSTAHAVEQAIFEASFTGGGTITVDRTCEGNTSPANTTHGCTASVTTTQADEYGITHSIVTNAFTVTAQATGWSDGGKQNTSKWQYRAFAATDTTDGRWTSQQNEITVTGLVTFYADTGAAPPAASDGLLLRKVGG